MHFLNGVLDFSELLVETLFFLFDLVLRITFLEQEEFCFLLDVLANTLPDLFLADSYQIAIPLQILDLCLAQTHRLFEVGVA